MLILNSFEKTLENFNIAPINPIGEEFNPELHEAVTMVNESGESDNIVVKTLEKRLVAERKSYQACSGSCQ